VIEKRGPLVMLESGRNLPLVGALTRLPDGVYRLGFRADAVAIGDGKSQGFNFPGEVKVTELSGSESFVHVDVGVGVWVCLAPGVHEWQPGAQVEARVDANRVFVFDSSGGLATTPFIAQTA
jgi:glycerol transport system ATP-binding protein